MAQRLTDKDILDANKLYNSGFFKEAYVAFEQLTPRLLAEKDTIRWMLSLGRTIENRMYFQNRLSGADSILQVAAQMIHQRSEPLAQALLYNFMGIHREFTNQPDSALFYLLKAEELMPLHKDLVSLRAETAQNIGNVYRWSFYNFYQAEKFYRHAIALLEGKEDNRLLASVCYNLATVLRLKGDYEGGLEMAYKSISLHQKLLSNTERLTINSYWAIANIYFETERFDKAIQIVLTLLDGLEKKYDPLSEELLDYYHNISAYYFEIGDYRNGAFFLNKASRIVEYNKIGGLRFSDHLFLLGVSGTMSKYWKEAEENFTNCEEIRLRSYGDKHPKTGQLWYAMSRLYWTQGQKNKALDFAQKSVSAYLSNFKYDDSFTNPDTITYSGKGLVNSFTRKGDILLDIYTDSKQTRYLYQAFDTYQQALKVIQLNRENFEEERSQLLAASFSKKVYEKALHCLYLLQENSPKSKTNGLAFSIMGQSKAALLREQINKSTLLRSLGVPDSIMALEADLLSSLSILHNHLQEEDIEISNVLEIRGEIFIKNQLLDKLKLHLESNYPIYAELRFGKKNTNSEEVKKRLGSQEASLVEYFWGENALYALVMGSDFERLYQFSQTKEDQDRLKVLLGKTKEFSPYLSDFQLFTNNAWLVYQHCWEPFESNLTKKVIVIPDGALAFLPFEVLLTKPFEGNSPDYKTLSYLIKDKQINYNYSSDLKIQIEKTSKEVLAMSYSEPNAPEEKGFDPLLGAFDEVNKIGEFMNGEFLAGAKASKEYFINNAHRFGYLHLALHGVGDTAAAHKSYIHFRGGAGDGNLYVNELYGLHLAGAKVMLSACETGVGEQFSGEGVYSIGRAFLQAGASSVVQTLWKVSDRASLEVISHYYKLIGDNKEAGTALRESKLQFLLNADELSAHPAFWASWCYIGEETHQTSLPLTHWFGYLAALTLLILIAWLVYRSLR